MEIIDLHNRKLIFGKQVISKMNMVNSQQVSRQLGCFFRLFKDFQKRDGLAKIVDFFMIKDLIFLFHKVARFFSSFI